MKQNVTESMFIDAFQQAGRGEQFSRTALSEMYDYFTDLENDIGEEIELDVIAICCEWTEYDSLEDFQSDYGVEGYETLDDIRDNTTVIEMVDGFIIQQF